MISNNTSQITNMRETGFRYVWDMLDRFCFYKHIFMDYIYSIKYHKMLSIRIIN